jgi:hypothetical protein
MSDTPNPDRQELYREMRDFLSGKGLLGPEMVDSATGFQGVVTGFAIYDVGDPQVPLEPRPTPEQTLDARWVPFESVRAVLPAPDQA